MRPRFRRRACGGESETVRQSADNGAKPIDPTSERAKAKAEERKRLAEALRANLRRRKAGRTCGAPDAEAPAREAPALGASAAGKE